MAGDISFIENISNTPLEELVLFYVFANPLPDEKQILELKTSLHDKINKIEDDDRK